jgi:hypothetical protein
MMKYVWKLKNTKVCLLHNFEANHNKDYSVVKTLGSLVLQRGIFFALVYLP